MRATNAAEKLITDLATVTITTEQEHDHYRERVNRCTAALTAAWSNPAIAEECDAVKCRLGDAFYDACHRNDS